MELYNMDKKIFRVTINYVFPVHAESPEEAEKIARISWYDGLYQEVEEFGEFKARQVHVTNEDDLPAGYKNASPWPKHPKNCGQILNDQREANKGDKSS